MKKIPFVKMAGAGNDFIIIEAGPGLDYTDFAKKICLKFCDHPFIRP